MTPATVSSAAAAAAPAGGNHYYANISQQHDQCKKKNTCSNMATDATQVTLLIDYNFARKLRRRRVRHSDRRCAPHGNSRVFSSKTEETDFCLVALLVAVLVFTQNIVVAARYYNSILSCYLVIRVGK